MEAIICNRLRISFYLQTERKQRADEPNTHHFSFLYGSPQTDVWRENDWERFSVLLGFKITRFNRKKHNIRFLSCHFSFNLNHFGSKTRILKTKCSFFSCISRCGGNLLRNHSLRWVDYLLSLLIYFPPLVICALKWFNKQMIRRLYPLNAEFYLWHILLLGRKFIFCHSWSI